MAELPHDRSRWLIGAACSLVGALVLAAAVGGWWLANATLVASHENSPGQPTTRVDTMPDSTLPMPDVRGLDEAAAKQVLADAGVPVDSITTHDTPSVAKLGVVVEQDPAFGARAVSKVNLGLAVPVTMPDLVGKTRQEATEILSGFGVGVNVTYGYSAGAAAESVLSEDPGVGKPLAQTAALVIATTGSTLPLGRIQPITGGCRTEANVQIDGRSFATALSCSTMTDEAVDTTWMLSKTVDRFTTTISIADDGKPGSTTPFAVLIDGKTVTKGTAIFGASTAIDLSCTGAIQLTIRVGPAAAEDVDVVLGEAVLYGSDEGITRLVNLR